MNLNEYNVNGWNCFDNGTILTSDCGNTVAFDILAVFSDVVDVCYSSLVCFLVFLIEVESFGDFVIGF